MSYEERGMHGFNMLEETTFSPSSIHSLLEGLESFGSFM